MDDEWAVPGYTSLRELGVGNGGRVVLAVHDASGVPVAIKYLSQQLFEDKTFLTRFRVEARLLAGIRDPNLVRFYEYVESSTAAAIIMELVDGITLRQLLRREGPTGPEAALAVLKGSLLGLAAAHSAGVVHRDYKPSNVLIDGDGQSKLADFGIALPAGHAAAPSGTPAYMAPEQWAGEPATPATDVYAATAVFFECLTGRPPYERPTIAQMARAHATAPIPIKQIPEPLWVMFAHGLAKDPLDRPPTAAMFLEEVEEAARLAYGPRWETRGRNRLVELAALLVLLFPLAESPGRIASVLGLTRLSKDKTRTLAAAGVGALVILAGVGTAALRAGHNLEAPTNLAAPMSTPGAVPPGGLGKNPQSPNPDWQMPGGLPTGGWTPPPPDGSLPTSPVANPSPIGGTPPTPGTTKPGTKPTKPGSGSGGGTSTPPGGSTGGGGGTPTDTPTTPVDPPTTPVDPPTTPVDPPTSPVESPPTDTGSGGTGGTGEGGGGTSLLTDLVDGLDIG